MLYPLSYEGGAPSSVPAPHSVRRHRSRAAPAIRARRAGCGTATVQRMVTRTLDLPPDQAFRLVAALGEHGRWIPLTRVTTPAGPTREGDIVVARSAGLFVDRMQVVRLDPPRTLVLRKLGPVLLGTATITVAPGAHRGEASVSWVYDARLRGPLPASAVLDPALEAMAALALWRMARWVGRMRSRS